MIGMGTIASTGFGGLSSRAVGAVTASLALDSSGNGRHGTYIGAPALGTLSLIVGGTSATFPTTSDYVFVGDYAALSFPSNVFTLEFWYWEDSASSTRGILSKQDVAGSVYEYAVYRNGTSLEFRAWTSGGTVVYSTSYGPVGITAHYYAWVCTGAFAILYVDGVQVSSTAKSTSSMADTAATLKLAVGEANPTETAGTEFDVLSIGLREDRAVFVRVSSGETIGLGFADSSARVITDKSGTAPPLIPIISGEAIAIQVVEPQDVTYDIATSSDALRLGMTEASSAVEITGGVRTDVGRLTQLSPAACPGRRYRSRATRTVARLTTLSPASCPGRFT
jgi:hypothetical protein